MAASRRVRAGRPDIALGPRLDPGRGRRVAEGPKLAREILKARPEDAAADLLLRRVETRAGQPAAAREAYEGAEAHAGEDAPVLVTLSAAWLVVGDHEAATRVVGRLLALDPEHPRGLTQAAWLSLARGGLKAADLWIESAAQAAPRDAHMAYLEGLCLERQERRESAVNAYRRAPPLAPDEVRYQQALAYALVRNGLSGSAVTFLLDAIAAHPKDASLQLQLGLLKLDRRRYPEARDALEKAASLAPVDPLPHWDLAFVWGDGLGKDATAPACRERLVESPGR